MACFVRLVEIRSYKQSSRNLGSYINLLGTADFKSKWRSVTPANIADEKTPICFMWHCEGDDVVDAAGVLRYSTRLLELGISQQTIIYPRGRHGIGLVNEERFAEHTYMRSWAPLAVEWLRLHEFIN